MAATSACTVPDLDEIRVRAAAATRGPWRWAGNMDHSEPRLIAPGRDVLGHFPRERDMQDREARARIGYAIECEQVSDGHGGWRPITEDEAAENVRESWLLDEYDEVRKDDRMGFVNDHLFYDEARSLAVYEVCPTATDREDPRVYRADIVSLRHPDAEFIAHARADVDALLAEVDRLGALLVSTDVPAVGDV
jgi:hypothetical protein